MAGPDRRQSVSEGDCIHGRGKCAHPGECAWNGGCVDEDRLAQGRRSVPEVNLVPEVIVICARCGYDAWRENYPCNRCGGLEARRYVPVDAVVEALRGWPDAAKVSLTAVTDRIEHPAVFIEQRFGSQA